MTVRTRGLAALGACLVVAAILGWILLDPFGGADVQGGAGGRQPPRAASPEAIASNSTFPKVSVR